MKNDIVTNSVFVEGIMLPLCLITALAFTFFSYSVELSGIASLMADVDRPVMSKWFGDNLPLSKIFAIGLNAAKLLLIFIVIHEVSSGKTAFWPKFWRGVLILLSLILAWMIFAGAISSANREKAAAQRTTAANAAYTREAENLGRWRDAKLEAAGAERDRRMAGIKDDYETRLKDLEALRLTELYPKPGPRYKQVNADYNALLEQYRQAKKPFEDDYNARVNAAETAYDQKIEALKEKYSNSVESVQATEDFGANPMVMSFVALLNRVLPTDGDAVSLPVMAFFLTGLITLCAEGVPMMCGAWVFAYLLRKREVDDEEGIPARLLHPIRQ